MMIDTFLTRYIFCVLSTCLSVLYSCILLGMGEDSIGILIKLQNGMYLIQLAFILMDVITFNGSMYV